MKAGNRRAKTVISKRMAAAAALAVLMAVVTLAVREYGAESGDELDRSRSAVQTRPVRSLTEAGNAHFVSIIKYNPDGQPGSAVMVSSGTDEFNSLAQALMLARPVTGATDETFDSLMVVSFGRGDTLDVIYSPKRNLLIAGEQAYEPAADLAPLLGEVEKQFNY